MTHDFHYYVTYMCARNAGYDIKTSIKIALCADGVDGGTPNFARESNGKYCKVTREGYGSYYPLTVYHTKSSVNSQHSIGASIACIPWMAFHFLPSLEVTDRNPYLLNPTKVSSARTNEDKKALSLESGLICCNNSRFADQLIKYTAKIAKQARGSKTKNITLDDDTAAQLGVRAHIIADLFAHSGFAGCRSVHINALSSATNKKKINYQQDTTAKLGSKVIVRGLGAGRLGHGQAGQRPDEPFLKYAFTRSKDGRTFMKDNYDLFGQAVMTVTQVLKGDVLKGTQPQDYDTWYSKWQEKDKTYKYKWSKIRDNMNNNRSSRVESLQGTVAYKDDLRNNRGLLMPYMTILHDRSDYWPFNILAKADQKWKFPKLAQSFSNAADNHLQWFHKTFSKLSGFGVDKYFEVSILWLQSGKDEKKAIKNTQNLMAGEELNIGSTTGRIKGVQLGTHYMEGGFKPDIVFQNLQKTYGPTD